MSDACLFGGAGNDRLKAGAGDSILVGGAGDDLLTGGRAGNVLIGGAGGDRLVSGGGDDILIGATTDFDANGAALCAIMTNGRGPIGLTGSGSITSPGRSPAARIPVLPQLLDGA